MSQETQAPEQPKLSLIDQFKQQKAAFVQQSNQLSVQFQQLQGAIFACDQMIAKMEENAIEHIKELAEKTKGGQGDGEADQQEQEQAA